MECLDVACRRSFQLKKFCGIRSNYISLTHKIGNFEERPRILSDIHCYRRWLLDRGRVTSLPGVTIGKGTIIGAGAVVTKVCEPNSIYAGVPARKIRALDENMTPEPKEEVTYQGLNCSN